MADKLGMVEFDGSNPKGILVSHILTEVFERNDLNLLLFVSRKNCASNGKYVEQLKG